MFVYQVTVPKLIYKWAAICPLHDIVCSTFTRPPNTIEPITAECVQRILHIRLEPLKSLQNDGPWNYLVQRSANERSGRDKFVLRTLIIMLVETRECYRYDIKVVMIIEP